MRNLLVCLAAVLLVFGSLALTADAGPGKGAVKTDLRERTDPGDTYGSGPVAGWVILNTNAEGMLIVTAKLTDEMPETDFTIWVVVDGTWLAEDLGSMTTNRNCKGVGHLKLDLADYLPADYPEDTVPVRVVVDNWYPGSMPLPYVGFATSEEDVPLKQ